MDYMFNKPQQNRPQQNRPQQNRPQQNRPQQNRPQQNRPQQNRPQQNRPQQNRPQQNRPQQNRPQQNRPQQNRPQQNRPQHQNKQNHQGDKQGFKFSDNLKSGLNITLNLFFIVFSVALIFFIVKCAYYIYVDDCEKMDLPSYLFSFNISPCSKKKKDIVRTITREKEVFHISDQIYTFEEAKCKCDSYGVRLATKQEIVDAYNKGANWCSYGWCEGSFAYYPVQEDFYQLIQATPELRGTCGKPGLNGGLFEPELRFGINCYGIKPKGVHTPNSFDTDPNDEDRDICKIDDVKDKVQAKGSDSIISFSNNKWSIYD